MRPVKKKNAGDLLDGEVISDKYNPHRNAKQPLISNLGCYCSYCESPVSKRDIQVEHVKPQSRYPELIPSWDNFLLSCSTCNGKDNKGTKDVANLDDFHLPHLDNTFLSFKYLEGGPIIVNPDLDESNRRRAENLRKLVGFDKKPSECAPTDERWLKRIEIWKVAKRHRAKFENGHDDIKDIMESAHGYGHWSIWFTVFEGIDEVRRRLISDFPGTRKECFDPENGYKPVPV